MSKTVPWSACEESGLLNLDERRMVPDVLDLLRLTRPLTGLSSICASGGFSRVLGSGNLGWESSDGGGGGGGGTWSWVLSEFLSLELFRRKTISNFLSAMYYVIMRLHLVEQVIIILQMLRSKYLQRLYWNVYAVNIYKCYLC